MVPAAQREGADLMSDAVEPAPKKFRVGDGTPGPGRKKGIPNKNTLLLKDAIMAAATQAGGKEGLIGYLVKQANGNPAAFMSLLGKVLPTQIESDNAAIAVVRIERVIIDP